MDWRQHAGLSERWQTLSRGHAAEVNGRLRDGVPDAEPRSGDDRATLCDAVLDVVRSANAAGAIDELRCRFAPAHAPFVKWVGEHGQPVGPVFMLEDGRVAVVSGAPWRRPRAWVATQESVEPLLGVFALGRSSNRNMYALGRADGVYLTEGWGGPSTTVLPWPTSYGPGHPDMQVPMRDGRPSVTELVPFDDGQRAVMISPSGVFLLTPQGSVLVHPAAEDVGRYIDEDGDEAFPLDLVAVHADLSSDQAHMVVGDQASPHRVLSAEGALIAAIEPAFGQPQCAAFTIDGSEVLLSGRADDKGRTVCVSIERVSAQLHWRPTTWRKVIEPAEAITVARARPGGFLLGDAAGFVRRWSSDTPSSREVLVGGTVRALDASADGRSIVVGTDAGVVHRLDFDPQAPDPFAIGTAVHREVRRWMFWRSESSPLIW